MSVRHFDPDDWKPCPYCYGGFEYEDMHSIEGGKAEYKKKMYPSQPRVFKGRCGYCNGTDWIFNGFDTEMTLEEIRVYFDSLPKPDPSKYVWNQPGASEPLPFEVVINSHILRGKDELLLLERATAIWIKEGGKLVLGEGFFHREKGKIFTSEEYDIETYELIEGNPAQVTTPYAGRITSTHDKESAVERIA